MDRSKAYEILKSLNEKEYVTARDISESCEISIKTIRNRITDINKMLVYQKVEMCIRDRYSVYACCFTGSPYAYAADTSILCSKPSGV